MVSNAQASLELDRKYSLKSIGYLKSWDNVDGLFSDYVDKAYEQFFLQESRFEPRDLSKEVQLLETSKISYRKLIQDKRIIGEIARSARVESLIRTRIYKEGAYYKVKIEWLHAPQMNLLAESEFHIDEPKSGETLRPLEIENMFSKALTEMTKKVPFYGQVSGRDGDWITVDLGQVSGVRKGDLLVISTLEEVRVHPLLKKVVDWKLLSTGRIVVEEVEDRLAFCRLQGEVEGQSIGRFQKISRIYPVESLAEAPVLATLSQKPQPLLASPRFGWGAGSLWLGVMERSYSNASQSVAVDGSGFFYGMIVNGRLWVTKGIFADLEVGYGLSKVGQEDLNSTSSTTSTSTLASSLSLSVLKFQAAVGYKYFFGPDIFDMNVWARAGYRSFAYSVPASTTNYSGPVSWKFGFIGIGGELPILQSELGEWGATVNVDVGLIGDASGNGFSDTTDTDGASDISFYLGALLRYSRQMTFKLGLDIMSHTASFADGGELSYRSINLRPTFVYHF